MTEANQQQGRAEAPGPESEELAPTPLDHPLFLPVLFVGLALWFGYDAYFTVDPDMLEHQDFNRYGFRVLVFLGLLYGYRGACEMKATPSHPMVVPALLLLSTLWLGYDAWISTDAHNLSRAGLNRELAPWMVALTLWFGFTGWLGTQGKREPAFILPVLILACASWFGYNGFLNEADAANADRTVNRWVAMAIFAAFLVSAYFAARRRSAEPAAEAAPQL
jgi:hypothetical protein